MTFTIITEGGSQILIKDGMTVEVEIDGVLYEIIINKK